MGRKRRGHRHALATAFTAAVALAATALPGAASADVLVTANGGTIQARLDGAASNIAISGDSDEQITLTETSSSGPLFSATFGGGATCTGDGSRSVTCTAPVSFPALIITDDAVLGPLDTIDATASPVLLSTGGAAGMFTSPVSLTGSPSSDFLRGSDGADTIDAFDSAHDDVDCKGGLDEVRADPGDSLVNCEYPTVIVDGDVDGYTTEEDCDDKDPAIHPGAKEVAGNGRDEDCDGKDESLAPALVFADADKDGIAEPEDCDDKDAKIRPGALEIPGNKVDENCDRVVAPFPQIGSGIHSSFQMVGGNRTRVVDLSVTDVPQGATILLSCNIGHHGSSTSSNQCPFSKRSFGFGRGPRQSVSLEGSFSKRKLKPGVVITVTVTAPQTIGRQVAFKTRRKKEPSVSTACVEPQGSTCSVSCACNHL
jgi:hypothetical protein